MVFYRVHICWNIDRYIFKVICKYVVSVQDILRESDISFRPHDQHVLSELTNLPAISKSIFTYQNTLYNSNK